MSNKEYYIGAVVGIWLIMVFILFVPSILYSTDMLGDMGEAKNFNGIMFWTLVSLFIGIKFIEQVQKLPDYLGYVGGKE